MAATIFRLRATIDYGGVAALCTTYWNPLAASDSAAATEALARVRASFDAFKGHMPLATTVNFDVNLAKLQDQDGVLFGVATGAAPGVVSGTASGDVLPFQTQGLLKYGTGVFVSGRALQGRTFLPFVLESDNSGGGSPAAGYVSAVNGAFGLLGTTIATAIGQVIWHRPSAPGASDGSSSAVTSRACATTWAVQKGRRS